MFRLRNKFIALACVCVFAGLGVLYYRGWVVKSPFSVVLVLVEGLDPGALAAARFGGGSEPRELRLDRIEHTALVHLQKLRDGRASPDGFASIMATGATPAEGGLSTDARGRPLPTLLDKAHASGRSTGIVTNGDIASLSLAPFYANAVGPVSPAEAVAQLVDVERADVLFGELDSALVTDAGRRLLDEFRAKEYDVATSMLDVLDRPEWKFPRMVGIFSPGDIAPAEAARDPSAATLPKLVRAAVRFLQYNRNGYLLVVHVTRRPDGASVIDELEQTLRSVRDFAGASSLLVICGMPVEGAPPSDMLSFAHGPYADDLHGTKSPGEMHELVTRHF